MPDDKQPLYETDDERRQRRQQALRSLAQTDQDDDVPHPAASAAKAFSHVGGSTLTPPRHRTWRVVIAAMLGVALLASLGYFTFFRSAPAKTTTAPLVTSSADNHLACAKGMAISHDGVSVAILGYQRDCPSAVPQDYAYYPGQINIYATKTGELIAGLQPDDIITKVLHPQIPLDAQPASRNDDISHAVIQYKQIFWSPDGAQLAIEFSVPVYSAATPTNGDPSAYTQGVLLTDIHATHTHILAYTRNPLTVYTGVWNLATDAYITIPAGVDQSHWTPAPPAFSYTWDSTSALVAQGPALLSTTIPSTPEAGPIGNPIGGHSFTIWQSAQIQPILDAANNDTSSAIPGAYYFSADFPAWSPNADRLVLDMHISDVLVAQRNGSTDLGQAHIGSDMPLLALRDKGLAAALADLKPTVHADGSPNVLGVVWRPDGRVLAASAPPYSPPGQVNRAPAEVRLYDCASGKLLGTLHSQPLSSTQQVGALYLRWTPDGSHLLLLDTGTGHLTIWGPNQLPKG